MSLFNDLEMLKLHFDRNRLTLKHNADIFQIYEGDLLPFIEADLKAQLNPKSYKQIRHRIAPINLLKQLVDKLSTIYSKPPTRRVINGKENDKELFDWYIETTKPNMVLNFANEFFNMFKNTLVMPFVRERKPALRVVPSDRFVVFGADPIDPARMTHLMLTMGTKEKEVKQGKFKTVEIFHIWTDNEFLIVDEDLEIQFDEMLELRNPDGLNQFQKIPGIYINRSLHNIIPLIDTDLLKMVKLIPVLISDLNFAVMFQAFSIIYGIDLDKDNLEMSPNSFWSFKSDAMKEGKPQIGQIKPQVDIIEVMEFIHQQLAFWLKSRAIRPGSSGKINAENKISGFSKVVDEMDTFQDREKQVIFFGNGEDELWPLIAHNMHPVWVANDEIDMKKLFIDEAEFITKFPEQRPDVRRGDLVDDLQKEVAAGFTSIKRAIEELNPEMEEEEVQKLIAEIEQESIINIQGDINEQGHTHTMPDGTLLPWDNFKEGEMHDHQGNVKSSPNTIPHEHELLESNELTKGYQVRELAESSDQNTEES